MYYEDLKYMFILLYLFTLLVFMVLTGLYLSSFDEYDCVISINPELTGEHHE